MNNNIIMGILLVIAGVLWSGCLMCFPHNVAAMICIPWGGAYGVVAMLYLILRKD